MLFDKKDLRIFDNTDSRNYFKEIIQCTQRVRYSLDIEKHIKEHTD